MARRPSLRRRTLISVAAGIAGVLVFTLAVLWPGYEEQQLPIESSAVWALQTGDGTRYARVNTDLGELDTVRTVENPSTMVQSSSRLLVFTQANAAFADVNLALPQDIDASETDALVKTPQGTVTVVSAGDHIAYLTEAGKVFTAKLSDPEANAEPLELPAADVAVSAIAVNAQGTLVAYLASTGTVVTASLNSRQVEDESRLEQPVEANGVELTLIDNTWYLFDAAERRLFLSSLLDGVELDVSAQARLQQPSERGDGVYLADEAGLYRFADPEQGAEPVTRSGDVAGVPAAPVTLGGEVFAAWLPEGSSGGFFYAGDRGVRPLSYGEAEIADAPLPEFHLSGNRAILNDTRSGWVWRVPSGDLVTSSQSWTNDRTSAEASQPDTERAEEVIEPKPPVAADDSFGVRANSQIALPLLLNDSDPNTDVLTIEPESLTALSADFGSLALAENNQQVLLTVAPSAAGTASFSYRLTDGTSSAGLTSNTATVTLTVVAESTNRAPVWCGVEGCLAKWPSPEMSPGDTVSTAVLEAWVDPDGDPVFVADARNSSAFGSVTFTPQGSVITQHPDPNQESVSNIAVDVTVSDSRGATANKPLTVTVTPTPTMQAANFAAAGVIEQRLTVETAEHVTATSGEVRLTSVDSLDTQRSSATINSSAASFDFEATEPGSYLVRYTVRDDLAERTGLVRILMSEPATAQFAAAPVTAFVWADRDTTLDLTAVVNNPTGRVVMISNATASPSDQASLSADVIAQRYLRLTGSSETFASGSLGSVSYEVVDAVTSQRSLGVVSVQLMPMLAPSAPVAMDDRITVRAGSQVDLPVLENDTASPGSQMTLDPAGVTNPDAQGSLAFVSDRVIRYLAPAKSGVYELSYRVLDSQQPKLADVATVTVTVLGDEANRKPQPRNLFARALSGQTVQIPFDALGVDPDGDAVELDQILDQPDHGTAAITADGLAIEYTAEIGFTGQVSFAYQVRDSKRDVGTGRVWVGVRDAAGDPSPIAYTDTVSVQLADDNTITVQPLRNDVDPSGLALTLVSVRPNAVADSDEYASLQRRIVDTTKNSVTISAGDELGTGSFIYTIENSAGDTAKGLIVVHVIRDAIADLPIVTDTVLDVATREEFPRGVDVVSSKVSWATGSVDDLTLALWGAPGGVSSQGWRISGSLPERSRVIAFSVTGPNSAGVEATGYGFLRVPGNDDLRLALRPNLPDITVEEGERVEFDMAKLVLAPPRAELELLDGGVRSSGVRDGSTCQVTSGTNIRYQSGSGAPWNDSCTVPIRLAGQSAYTYLTVPITVEADKPQPVLRSAGLTVSPGESVEYDLRQMITWTGGEDWPNLSLNVDPGGSDFSLTQSGTVLQVVGGDRAKPGAQQVATVSVTSHEAVTPATLTLRVGPAPSTLPKGATVTQQCSQADALSCDIRVVGVAGEVNPLPGTALELVSVEQPTTCAEVSFAVANATTVRASFTEAAVGAQCTANFIVKDAQDRQSLGDRMGQVTLDLQGFPQAPAAVVLRSFADRTVTLAVNPGQSSNAYPSLERFVILRDGQEVSTCSATGQDCTPITGLTNGDPVTFEARAVNAVGQSRGTNPTITTWSYRVPTVSSVTATPVYSATETTQSEGVVEVVIDTSDPEVRAFTVTGANGEVTRTGNRTQVNVRLSVSTPSVSVTPLSAIEAPDGGSSAGTATTVGVNVAGKPMLGALSVASVSSSSVTVNEVSVDRNNSTRPTEVVYAAYRSSGSVTCSVGSNGTGLTVNVTDGVKSTGTVLSGLTANTPHSVVACVSNGFGVTQSNVVSATPFAAPAAPTGYEFSITDGSVTGQYRVNIIAGDPAPPGFSVRFNGAEVTGQPLTITARFCLTSDLTKCSDEAAVAPRNSNATVAFDASTNAQTSCQVGSPANIVVDSMGVTGRVAEVRYQQGSNTWLTLGDPTDPIPPGATAVQASYAWTAPGTAALTPYLVNCTP